MKKIIYLILVFESCVGVSEKGLLDPSNPIGLFIQTNLCNVFKICPRAKPASETSRELTSFVFSVPPALGIISDGKVNMLVPFFSDRAKLKAGFTHNGSRVEVNGKLQESGVTENNFTKPVKYRVIAKDGNSRIYDVNVKNASASAKEIFQFGLNSPNVSGFVTGNLNASGAIKIIVAVPFGTAVNSLVAKFITSGNSVNISGVNQISGVSANDFTNPLIYTIVAADNSTKTYEVSVQVGGTNTKDLLSFRFDSLGVVGNINANSVNVILPSGISPYNQIASFTSNGKFVKVSGNIQISGTTPIDFSSPVVYTIEADDGSTANYTVNLIVATGSDKEIIAYSLPSVGGTATITTSASSGTIDLNIPNAADVSNTIANFSISGLNIFINEREQISAQTFNNFNNPITYTVQAADGSQKNFLVKIKDTLTITINGLTASGLILYNGQTSVSVASGSTSSTIQLDSSLGNRIQISAQPTGQVCAFTGNSSGNLSSENPTTLNINCINGFLYAGKVLPYNPVGRSPYDTVVNRLFQFVGTGSAGSSDNTTGLLAQFNAPIDIEVLGNFAYVADLENNCIRRIELTGNKAVTTIAGLCASSNFGITDGIGSAARFNKPHGISTDGANLFITDFVNHTIRQLNLATNEVTTIAGTGGISGSTDGIGSAARFNQPSYSTYHDGNLYITDTNQDTPNTGKIRKLSLATKTVTTLATGLDRPRGITNDGTNIYFADTEKDLIKKIDIAAGVLTTLAGSGTTASYDAIGTAAHLNKPYGLDIEGNFLYFLEAGTSRRFRKINLTTNRVETFFRADAGNSGGDTFTGTMCFTGSTCPTNFTIRGNTIYFADRFSHRIFELKPANNYRYYPLAGNANEATNTGFNGTVSVPGTVTPARNHNGVTGGALRFDGSSHIQVADETGLPTGNSARTMCAWINAEDISVSAQDKVIISYGTSGTGNNSFLSFSNPLGTTYVQFGSIGSIATEVSRSQAITVPLYTWVHVCGTINSGLMEIYFNGATIGPSAPSGEARTFNTTLGGGLRIGGLNDGTSSFKGKIADVRIYDRALSIGEIHILATNIPEGLVANFPFSQAYTGSIGAEDDIWFNRIDMTRNATPPYNANVIPLPGSFGKSVGFNGTTQYLSNANSTTNLLPGGNSPRTLCAWMKPTVSTSQRMILFYGTGEANCLFINVSNSYYCTDSSKDLLSTYNGFSLAGVWYHMCGTYDGTTMNQYINGSLIGNKLETLNTNTTNLFIGVKSNPLFSQHFFGDIDEVRIYSRVLSLAEIRTLASPTKRMFLTASTPTGSMGGISGADSICNADSARPDTEKIYKAFLVGGGRTACTTANCSLASENADWVLKPFTTYYQPYDSIPGLITNPNSFPILTANAAGILPISGTLLLNPLNTYFGAGGTDTWNGFATTEDWRTGLHCINWTTTGGTGEIGYWGGTSNTIPNVNGLLNNGTLSCSIGRRLICVEQ